MVIEWLNPWHPVEREDVRRALFDELRREAGPAHPLRGLAAIAVGRRQDNDDVLFSLVDGRMAVVHLTWTGKEDASPHPWMNLYPTTEAFVRDRMLPDHAKWTDSGMN